MLAKVDAALRQLFEERMKFGAPTTGGVEEGQIGIQPPDKDWITDVEGFTRLQGLNVYLAEVYENRALRTTDTIVRRADGQVFHDPAPMRLDCHYLLSGWSAATDRKQKTVDEHSVLAEALAALYEAGPITVDGVELPTMIAPPGGFPKLAEFWGTMGQTVPWRPVVELVVTIPIAATNPFADFEVTTLFTEFLAVADQGTAERTLQFGGVVLDASVAPPIVITRAWVALETPAGAPVAATACDSQGRFVFTNVEPGAYRLRARAEGRPEAPLVPITVPSASGHYDVEFP